MLVETEIKGQVGWLTLNRPEAMNALSPALLVELEQGLARFEADPAVRAVVLTANGRAFCAGADLKAALAPSVPGQDDLLDLGARVFNRLRNLPKPVIAAVNGHALAGGMELVLASDLVLAAEGVKMGDGHANFGVFPAAGGAAVLPRKLPANIAKFMLFTGDTLDAAFLQSHGLVHHVVAREELAHAAQQLAEKLATRSQAMLRRMKRVVNEAIDKNVADALRDELLEARTHLRSKDAQEGITAFQEKRQPIFKGD